MRFASNEGTSIDHEFIFLTLEILSQDEIDAYKKGRNKSHNARKLVDMVTYQQATGFESLIGHLSIHDEQRAKSLIELGMIFIRQGGHNG